MNYVELSKEVSYALRHAPWEYELEMDEEGFVPVSQLLSALNETGHYERPITIDDLQRMMATNDKKRHEIVGTRIRALYGHSFPMRILKTEAVPPDILYHGTTHKAVEMILKEGLKPMSRQYVHMSVDVETAMSVGQRRESNPVILVIDAKAASHDGVRFYIGNEKVWLADNVPPKYISKKIG
jgi:putative RNA 2'-phosphotransferase